MSDIEIGRPNSLRIFSINHPDGATETARTRSTSTVLFLKNKNGGRGNEDQTRLLS